MNLGVNAKFTVYVVIKSQMPSIKEPQGAYDLPNIVLSTCIDASLFSSRLD